MAPNTLPIFPLHTPVLFPRCVAPLHVFEPRYRALIHDALAGERRIGMVTVRPEVVDEMPGDPAIFPVGCAGFIAQHQQLADGRYLILLQATTRFRVVREQPKRAARLYRVAEIEPLDELPGDPARADAHREQIVRQLGELVSRDAERNAEIDLGRLEGLDPGAFASEISQALRLPALEKQALLEANSAAERLERLAQTLSFYRTLSSSGPAETIH